MKKLTAIILVLSMIFCLCACGSEEEAPAERSCGVYVTVEANDVYAVSCGREDGSDSATHADGTKINAGETFHFDFAGEKAEGSAKAVVSYMICVYDKDLGIIADESFEDNFANMARIDIVVTEDHHIIYKGGEINCGGKLVVSMNETNDALGVYATETSVKVSNNESAGNKITDTLAGFAATFTEAAETNRASYTENTAGKGSDIPDFNMKHSVYVTRGDDAVVSFRMRDYAYLGTEERETVFAHNYDVQTGDELTLESVFTDVDALKKLCTEYILISTTSSEDVVFTEGFTEKIPELLKDGSWYFDNEGLVVIANRGELSDMSYEFSVPYSDIEQYLKEEFIPTALDDTQSCAIRALYAEDASTDDFVFVDNAEEIKPIIITATGSIYNVGVYLVSYDEESNSYGLTNELKYCSDLLDGGAFSLDTELGSTPNVLVQYTTSYGDVKNALLSVDENGDIVITDPDGGDEGIDIIDTLPFMIDLNCDGTDDEISFSGGTVNIVSGTDSSGFDTGVTDIDGARLYDVDLDGVFELFVSGSTASGDNILYCLKLDGVSLIPVPFDNEEYACGELKAFSADSVNVSSRINVLGTYSYDRSYKFADGKLIPAATESYKVISDKFITPNAELALIEGGTIAAGTEIKVVETDLSTFVSVQTADGTVGKLQLSQTDGDTGWLINGTPEGELFDSLPYAD